MPNRVTEPPIFCVFTAAKGWSFVGTAIHLFTGGDVTHAAIIYWSIQYQCWMTVGANFNGITEIPLPAFEADHDLVHLLAPVGWSMWDGLRAHVSDIDKKYNYSGLFGMAYVEIAKKLGAKPHANVLNDRDDLFCSEWDSEIVKSGLAQAGLAPQWPLMHTDSDIIDPAKLCAAEIASPLFSESHVSVLDQKWPHRGGGYGESDY